MKNENQECFCKNIIFSQNTRKYSLLAPSTVTPLVGVNPTFVQSGLKVIGELHQLGPWQRFVRYTAQCPAIKYSTPFLTLQKPSILRQL